VPVLTLPLSPTVAIFMRPLKSSKNRKMQTTQHAQRANWGGKDAAMLEHPIAHLCSPPTGPDAIALRQHPTPFPSLTSTAMLWRLAIGGPYGGWIYNYYGDNPVVAAAATIPGCTPPGGRALARLVEQLDVAPTPCVRDSLGAGFPHQGLSAKKCSH
jgi:hypothetical protein